MDDRETHRKMNYGLWETDENGSIEGPSVIIVVADILGASLAQSINILLPAPS